MVTPVHPYVVIVVVVVVVALLGVPMQPVPCVSNVANVARRQNDREPEHTMSSTLLLRFAMDYYQAVAVV
jgi:hypothetical protein